MQNVPTKGRSHAPTSTSWSVKNPIMRLILYWQQRCYSRQDIVVALEPRNSVGVSAATGNGVLRNAGKLYSIGVDPPQDYA